MFGEVKMWWKSLKRCCALMRQHIRYQSFSWKQNMRVLETSVKFLNYSQQPKPLENAQEKTSSLFWVEQERRFTPGARQGEADSGVPEVTGPGLPGADPALTHLSVVGNLRIQPDVPDRQQPARSRNPASVKRRFHWQLKKKRVDTETVSLVIFLIQTVPTEQMRSYVFRNSPKSHGLWFDFVLRAVRLHPRPAFLLLLNWRTGCAAHGLISVKSQYFLKLK